MAATTLKMRVVRNVTEMGEKIEIGREEGQRYWSELLMEIFYDTAIGRRGRDEEPVMSAAANTAANSAHAQ